MSDPRPPDTSLRGVAKRFAPRWVRDAVRDAVMRPYDLALVVKREGALRHWVSRHVLHLYYPPSLTSRQSAFSRWYGTRVRGAKPLLEHIDIHITDHCNLNCKGCGHFSNLCKPNFLELDAFEADMKALAEKLRLAQIYLLGGEPLLHPRIAEFIRSARAIFPDTRICVVTNGSLVMRQNDEFWRALSETATVLMCDAYPIDLPVAEIDRKAAEWDVVLEWTGERNLFFKLPLDVSGAQDPADSYRRCSGINNCPMYKDGRLYPCAYTSYIDVFKERFGVEGLDVTAADSVSVRDTDALAIMTFMTEHVPFCRFCDFDHFELYEWGRTERSIDEWTRTL